MNIEMLTKMVKERANKRTQEESLSMLKKAYILDSSGNLDAKFFTRSRVKMASADKTTSSRNTQR